MESATAHPTYPSGKATQNDVLITPEATVQERARLVIIGAGIVGCSAAYHLTRLGWRDIVVLDQGPLFETGGSTSHAPGGVFQTNFSPMMTRFAQYTVELYSGLELDGQSCFYGVGGMEVAATPQRWEDLKRKAGVAKSWGLEAALLSPQEAQDLNPLLNPDTIEGAYYVPTDGIARPVQAAQLMAEEARAKGAVFHGRTTVEDIEISQGQVRAVVTDQGRIETEQVLLCVGIWGPRIGRLAGVAVPLVPVQHLYTRSAPVPALAGETRQVVHPVLRHQDSSMYFRQHADCYGIGSYRHEPLVVEPQSLPSYRPGAGQPAIMPFTPEHFAEAHAAAVQLMPALDGIDLSYKINGLFSFTPDGMPLMGPAPEVAGFWLAEAVWITHAGGVGKTIAEWMVEGVPSMDLREADINRFAPHARTTEYARVRGAQQYREVYDIIHPRQPLQQPRPLRLSPFHPRLEALDAVFFESAGWERPQWFGSNEALPEIGEVPVRQGWAARFWSPVQGAEHLATRRRGALCDLSPLTKIEVAGSGALAFLQRLAANQIDRPVGRVVYTPLLDQQGGIRADLTIVRLEEDRFWVLTGGVTGPRDMAWLKTWAPTDGSVQIRDISAQYCCAGLWGPQARQVLQEVCEADLAGADFPYFGARRIEVDSVPVLALRLSYIGEAGWELYAPAEYGLALWDALWDAGRVYSIIALGSGAFDSLRLEKGYRLWGTDIHGDYNPLEAGLERTVRLDKDDFVGRQALLGAKEAGIKKRLCCMTLDRPDAVLLGKEPILGGDETLGYVTSADCGYSVGRFIAYGYLPLAWAAPGTKIEIEYFGERYKATVAAEPLFDPPGKRLKS
ncbi:MAG: FAD-dependent oxidoreductase [Candidatus Latescibacteria bacterium]|nr:FAD-dependent oxidoreductase [Candidatus Latescibacterota bacterium]